jgi:hypothetical protein
MAKWVLFFVLMACSSIVQAHQPDISSTMLVEQDGKWILQIRTSLTAFQQEVQTHFAETPYKTPEEFQAFVISHLKNNIRILFNGNDNVALENGYVKLGHETNVVFEVVGVPADIKSVLVKNSSFKDIHRNQSALVIFKKGFTQEQFILDNSNEHTVLLNARNSKFTLASSSKMASAMPFSNYAMLGLIILTLGLGTFFFVKLRRNGDTIEV